MISMLPPVPAENARACHKGSSNKLGNIPIEAATNGTLSIIAERNPNNIISTSVFGNISVRSDKELYLASSTYSEFGSAGSFYSGFVTEPQVVPELTISPLGTCINSATNSNVILKTANSFDNYQWEIYDDLTSSWIDAPSSPTTPNNQADYTPIRRGNYRLIGKLSLFPKKQ